MIKTEEGKLVVDENAMTGVIAEQRDLAIGGLRDLQVKMQEVIEGEREEDENWSPFAEGEVLAGKEQDYLWAVTGFESGYDTLKSKLGTGWYEPYVASSTLELYDPEYVPSILDPVLEDKVPWDEGGG